ncbi:helix-turn-helix domain-containing protein [Streptomyces specialis]|uniref:hypothetical protein n=1 Tax=Streptomyces specialis TaxID=498367 RepID=UPI00073E3B83|nr:hypothetical protein [Streptomyces specialis]
MTTARCPHRKLEERDGAKFCAGCDAQIYLPRRRPVPKEAAIRRYEEGESLASLAQSFAVSETTLRRRFTEWDIPLRAPAEASRLHRPLSTWND